jgi:hypothetical protein
MTTRNVFSLTQYFSALTVRPYSMKLQGTVASTLPANGVTSYFFFLVSRRVSTQWLIA